MEVMALLLHQAARPLLLQSLLKAVLLQVQLPVDLAHLTQFQVAMERESHPQALERQLLDMDLVRAFHLLRCLL